MMGGKYMSVPQTNSGAAGCGAQIILASAVCACTWIVILIGYSSYIAVTADHWIGLLLTIIVMSVYMICHLFWTKGKPESM